MRYLMLVLGALFASLGKPAQAQSSSCPPPRRVVNFPAESDPNVQRDQRGLLIRFVQEDNILIRLGPGLDLDFSDHPDSDFPLHFGRCVVLTSAARLDDPPSSSAEARTPKSPGPVLRFGRRRGNSRAFFEIRCFANQACNDGVRISGFRLYGPDFGQQSRGDIGIHVVRSVGVQIRNMEIAGWGGSGIVVDDDPGLDQPLGLNGRGGRIWNPDQILIHHNFFHHNQHPAEGTFSGPAAGYGVKTGPGAWARIYRNLFDFNRHSISASGDTGGYWAEHNLILKGGGLHGTVLNSHTHSFDVHGTGCAWSENLCGDAGKQFWYLGNAWQFRNDKSIKIRGMVGLRADILRNVFPFSSGDDAIGLNSSQNINIGIGNIFGVDSFGQYGVCDFDGDRIDDLFLPTGASWWYSSFGEFPWSFLRPATERLDRLRLGYFDSDRRCDLLRERDGRWEISSGGSSGWRSIGAFGAPLAEVRFGRFDPRIRDHRRGVTLMTTHAFWRRGDGQWFVTSLAAPDWKAVASSGFSLQQLRFGDFTGDGVTDVLAVENGRWAISESAALPWRRLNSSLGDPVGGLFIANMDRDDNIDDVLRLDRRTSLLPGNRIRVVLNWVRSRNGVEPWRSWRQYTFTYSALSRDVVHPALGFAGRFGMAPGGGTLVIDHERFGRFFSAAETAVGASPDWTSQFQY